jgi:hypothetical protein
MSNILIKDGAGTSKYIAASGAGTSGDPHLQARQMVDEAGAAYGVKHLGNKPRMSSTPYVYDIAEGNISGHEAVYKFGSNAAVGTSEQSIWREEGLYPWAAVDAAAGIVKISSTDAEDTLTTGTGAWTATIWGRSSSTGLDITETIELAGQTPVNSNLSYSRVFRVRCVTAGTGLANAGIIRVGTGTVSSGVPAVVWAHVATGLNQTLQAIWTVPTGSTFYLLAAEYSVDGTKGAACCIYARPLGELFQVKDVFFLDGGGLAHNYAIPRVFTSGTDIDFRATAGVSGTGIAANFAGWYE